MQLQKIEYDLINSKIIKYNIIKNKFKKYIYEFDKKLINKNTI